MTVLDTFEITVIVHKTPMLSKNIQMWTPDILVLLHLREPSTMPPLPFLEIHQDVEWKWLCNTYWVWKVQKITCLSFGISLVVYYEVIKRDLNRRPMYEYRCDVGCPWWFYYRGIKKDESQGENVTLELCYTVSRQNKSLTHIMCRSGRMLRNLVQKLFEKRRSSTRVQKVR
jgi:hypothetical protein